MYARTEKSISKIRNDFCMMNPQFLGKMEYVYRSKKLAQPRTRGMERFLVSMGNEEYLASDCLTSHGAQGFNISSVFWLDWDAKT